MTLRVDERTENGRACLDCGLEFPHITGSVVDADGPHAVYFASAHTHSTGTARIDVTLATWGAEPPAHDHVTFSCELRVGGAMAIDAPVTLTLTEGSPIHGTMLSREEALAHSLVGDFWAVVDAIGDQDPGVHQAVYGEVHRWPFEDPPDLGVFVADPVMHEGRPILWVVHDEDGDWLFGNGMDFDPKTAAVIHLSHVVSDHPDVAQVADLPAGWNAERKGLGSAWHRAEYHPHDEE